MLCHAARHTTALVVSLVFVACGEERTLEERPAPQHTPTFEVERPSPPEPSRSPDAPPSEGPSNDPSGPQAGAKPPSQLDPTNHEPTASEGQSTAFALNAGGLTYAAFRDRSNAKLLHVDASQLQANVALEAGGPPSCESLSRLASATAPLLADLEEDNFAFPQAKQAVINSVDFLIASAITGVGTVRELKITPRIALQSSFSPEATSTIQKAIRKDAADPSLSIVAASPARAVISAARVSLSDIAPDGLIAVLELALRLRGRAEERSSFFGEQKLQLQLTTTIMGLDAACDIRSGKASLRLDTDVSVSFANADGMVAVKKSANLNVPRN